MTKQQERTKKVLERMIALVDQDADYSEMFAKALDRSLDEIGVADGFGTEGQCDPRGDFRDGDFSMWNVQGVDLN